MYKRIFLDANILLDTLSTSRPSSTYSVDSYLYILDNDNMELFTSCDIITTLYYVGRKINKDVILDNIEIINKTLKVIEFSNKEVAQTCTLMKENKKYKDLEDTIQYVLAKKEGCDLIISNDENFYAEDIEILSSEEFLKKVGV
jgi:predicted nucleic acid-binding protein